MYSLDLPTYNPVMYTWYRIIHLRKLWACAEPRRTSARRGENPVIHNTRGFRRGGLTPALAPRMLRITEDVVYV